MRALPGMKIYSPSDSLMAEACVQFTHKERGPKYIRIDREGFPAVYSDKREINFKKGFSVLKEGKDLYIISTGRMVYTALAVAKKLSDQAIAIGVIDLFRIKPLEKERIWALIKGARYLVTLEEHFVTGGIGSMMAELLAIKEDRPLFKTIGIPDAFCRRYGSREYLHSLNKIDAESVAATIKRWIKKK